MRFTIHCSALQPISRNARIDPTYLELHVGRVTRPNLGLILRSACYNAGLGLSPKIDLKVRKSLVKSTAGH